MDSTGKHECLPKISPSVRIIIHKKHVSAVLALQVSGAGESLEAGEMHNRGN